MKIKIACISAFLIGVLFMGVGMSMSFLEFASMSYGGIKVIEPDKSYVQTFSTTLPAEDFSQLVISKNYAYKDSKVDIIKSEDIPDNEVNFEITYDSSLLEPNVLLFEDYDYSQADADTQPEDLPKTLTFVLDTDYYNEFATFMSLKDDLLESLKSKTLYTYKLKSIYDVKITVSPETYEKINPSNLSI